MKKCFFLFIFLVSLSLNVSCKEDTVVDVISGYDIDDGLPNYYIQHISDRISQVNNALSRNGNLDSFVFISDTHWEKNACHSGLLIKAILDNSIVEKVIHGGDVGSVTAYNSKLTGFDLIRDNMDKFSSFLIKPIGGHPFYAVRGNHDFNNVMENGRQEGYPIAEVKDFYMSFMPEVVYNIQDDNGLYYYFDNHYSKLRYIVIDTSYGSRIDMARFGASQLQWLLDNAITTTPAGYSIVLFSHIPISQGVDATGSYLSFVALNKILSDLNNKRDGTTVCEGVEISYDFSEVEYDVLLVMSGHIHADSQAFDNNVLYITTTCDRVSNDMPSQFEDGISQTRQRGDITEQAFDIVSVEKDFIQLIRVGAGFSRAYHRNVISLQINESIDLNEKLSLITPVRWVSNDSPGPIGNWYDKTWTYSSEVISVKNGVVTSNSLGSSLVVAEDINHHKEFFLINVESRL